MALKGNIGKFKYEISSETAGPSTPHEYNASIGGGNLNIKFDPTELATGASAASPHPTAAAGIDGKILIPQRQLENFPLMPAPTFSKTPADNVTDLAPDTFPSTTMEPTDHVTSDGQSIQSAFGSAQDFYSQISMNDIVDNTPSGAMSYAGYLAYNGLVDPRQQYAEDLDAANEMYARALGTYGMAGEGLAQGNLVNSGYSEYLNGNAYTQKAGWYRQALVDYQNRQNEYGAKYAQYKNDLAAQQEADEAAKDLPSEQSVNAYNYLLENVQNAGGLEAAKRYLAANGYSPEDIDAAIKNWQGTYAADTLSNIDRITSLASGNAAALKQQYGSGEEYNKVLAALQKKNGEMLDASFADDDDFFDNPIYYDFLSQYDSEDGTTAFADMEPDEQEIEFRKYVRSLYKSGDISQEQYHAFNKRTLDDEIEIHLENSKNPEDALGKIFEAVAKMDAVKGALSDKDYEDLYTKLGELYEPVRDKKGNITGLNIKKEGGRRPTSKMYPDISIRYLKGMKDGVSYLKTQEQYAAFEKFADWMNKTQQK